MLVNGIFKQPTTMLFLMFLANFRRWEIFSSSDEVYDVSISWNYILLTVTDNFGQGKWAKIERNDGKLLRRSIGE